MAILIIETDDLHGFSVDPECEPSFRGSGEALGVSANAGRPVRRSAPQRVPPFLSRRLLRKAGQDCGLLANCIIVLAESAQPLRATLQTLAVDAIPVSEY